MLDGEGEVLYVGKAKNLEEPSFTSYFRSTGLTTKTAALVKRIISNRCDSNGNRNRSANT